MLLPFVMKRIDKPSQLLSEIEKNFGRNLKRWFEENRKDQTQVDFGKELKIHQSTLSAIFAGNRCPKEKWRRQVSEYIGIPYDEMIGLTPAQDRSPPVAKIQSRKPRTLQNIESMLATIAAVEPENLKLIEGILQTFHAEATAKKKGGCKELC